MGVPRAWILRTALPTTGAVTVVAGSFLPWLRSGRRGRSSYELYHLARRLDFANGGVQRTGIALWPLVPVVVVAAALAAWAKREHLSAALGIAASLYVGAICVVAWRAPLPSMAGVAVTFAGAIVLLGSAGYLVGASSDRQVRRLGPEPAP